MSLEARIENLGPGAAHAVRARLVLPSELTALSLLSGEDWQSCSVAGSTVECTGDALAAGSVRRITVEATAPAAEISATAEVAVSAFHDPDLDNNADTLAVDVRSGLLFFDGFESGGCSLWSRCP